MSSNLEIATKIAFEIHPTKEGPEGEFSLRDIVITAVEGGINYWGHIEGYNPDAFAQWGRVTENEPSTDGPAKSGELTVATVRAGLDWRSLHVFREGERGAEFYFACLEYGQAQWSRRPIVTPAA